MFSDYSTNGPPETNLTLSFIEEEMCLSGIFHSSDAVTEEEEFTSNQLVMYLEACGVDLEPLPLVSQIAVSSTVFDSYTEKGCEILEPTPFAKDDCPWKLTSKVTEATPEDDQEDESFDTDLQGPSGYDVVCSRAKQFYQLPGCQRFRQIIRAAIPAYMRACSRLDKSMVIASTIDMVIHHPEIGRIRFWKYSNGTWIAMGSDQIRDKVGHALREMIQEVKRTQRQQTIRPVVAPAS